MLCGVQACFESNILQSIKQGLNSPVTCLMRSIMSATSSSSSKGHTRPSRNLHHDIVTTSIHNPRAKPLYIMTSVNSLTNMQISTGTKLFQGWHRVSGQPASLHHGHAVTWIHDHNANCHHLHQHIMPLSSHEYMVMLCESLSVLSVVLAGQFLNLCLYAFVHRCAGCCAA